MHERWHGPCRACRQISTKVWLRVPPSRTRDNNLLERLTQQGDLLKVRKNQPSPCTVGMCVAADLAFSQEETLEALQFWQVSNNYMVIF